MLQPLRWLCAEYAVHPERNVHKEQLICVARSSIIGPVAGVDKRAVPSVQSCFAVSIPPRCAL